MSTRRTRELLGVASESVPSESVHPKASILKTTYRIGCEHLSRSIKENKKSALRLEIQGKKNQYTGMPAAS